MINYRNAGNHLYKHLKHKPRELREMLKKISCCVRRKEIMKR